MNTCVFNIALKDGRESAILISTGSSFRLETAKALNDLSPYVMSLLLRCKFQMVIEKLIVVVLADNRLKDL